MVGLCRSSARHDGQHFELADAQPADLDGELLGVRELLGRR